MSKLYYDCPIEAALMAKNFGVGFKSKSRGSKLVYDGKFFEEDIPRGEYMGDWYVVHPDSKHVFEPKEGDKNIGGLTYNAARNEWVSEYDYNDDFGEVIHVQRWYTPHGIGIDERNGKAFIMPKREPVIQEEGQ